MDVSPGSTIVVPMDVTPINFLAITESISNIVGQLALAAASVSAVSKLENARRNWPHRTGSQSSIGHNFEPQDGFSDNACLLIMAVCRFKMNHRGWEVPLPFAVAETDRENTARRGSKLEFDDPLFFFFDLYGYQGSQARIISIGSGTEVPTYRRRRRLKKTIWTLFASPIWRRPGF